jgi:AcrR family transcriptional regulator
MSDENSSAQNRSSEPRDVRSRIIEATFHVLVEHGYAGTSTREIARRARVSKRELYALFDSKDGILAAMIASRATRMREPLSIPDAPDRASLTDTLTRFGISFLTEASSPAVLALFRLAMAEAERAPSLAQHLHTYGRAPTFATLVNFLTRAAASGLIDGAEPAAMAGRFFALLWGDLQISLLLRLVEAPHPDEIEERAGSAVGALLSLYALPNKATPAANFGTARRDGDHS